MGGPSPRPCVWATQLRSPKKHRSGGDTVSALTSPGNKPQTSHTDSDVVTTEQTDRYVINQAKQKYDVYQQEVWYC